MHVIGDVIANFARLRASGGWKRARKVAWYVPKFPIGSEGFAFIQAVVSAMCCVSSDIPLVAPRWAYNRDAFRGGWNPEEERASETNLAW